MVGDCRRAGGARLAAGRSRKRAKTCVSGARLEHLMCHLANVQLKTELTALEEALTQQEMELEDLVRARNEEAACLSHEVAALRRWLDPEGRNQWQEGGFLDLKAFDETLTAKDDGSACAATSSEVAALQQRLRMQRAEFAEVQRGARDAQDEAVALGSRLQALREAHEQEEAHPTMAELRHRCELLQRGPGGQLVALIRRAEIPAKESPQSLAAFLGDLAMCLDSLHKPGVVVGRLAPAEAR